ncbi:5-formyltetrahydrofolate cyclo-ligase [Riemerella columbina]|uniref:5-formyltetrahydrofolate cyclo-ligase n=1 Tax=Riemerella columbina TaxID=103810 RepID=UPI00036A0837|nr:5-formyltetrahydrofolate cyclo-ligase [Riemerella columbina]
MIKVELRTLYLKKRDTLTAHERSELSHAIIERFISQFKPIENQKIHCFLPIEKFNEIQTKILIEYCFNKKIKVFVPKMVGNDLISIELTPQTPLKKNKWGIEEPKSDEDSGILDFDYIITPLLYCDANGNRVGYGKGFYDRLFQQVSAKTLKVGVNYFPPKESIDDIWEGDYQLDYLVTPEAVLSFSALG